MRKLFVFLLCFSATVSAPARDSVDHWVEVRSPNFVVLTDSNEKQARRLASQFEEMRAVFHKLIPTASDSAGSPIVVVALKDKKAFQALEPAAYLAKGQLELAGLFMRAPDKNYILLRLDAEGEHPFATVYHEYTHFMLRNNAQWLPLWLNEGLAEFYQNTDILEKDVRLGQASADDIAYLRENRLIPLATLFKVDATSPYYHEEQKGSVFYAESWALTHYLTVTGRQKQTEPIRDYAEHLIKGQDSLVAAQQAFGNLDQLQKALNSYIQQGQFMMFVMKTPESVDASKFTVRSVPNADADAVRADVLVYNDRKTAAQTLLDETLRDDPKNALAHETMGYLKFREGDIAAAKKWYGEAVQLDSQSYLANYYYATMSMQSNDRDHDADIESSLRNSIKMNPGFAPAYDALANFYGSRHERLSDAHVLNIQAVELEPGNLNYRLNTASVLMEENQFPGAVSVLKTAQPLAKTPDEVAMVESRIQQIERYQADVEHSHQAENHSVVETGASNGVESDTRTVTMTSGDGRTFVLKPDTAHEGPKYPTEPTTGTHHTASGVLNNVHCYYPTTLTLKVDGSGKAVDLYRNDFYQIEFSATNFTPKGDINPCKDIEGYKAKVEYAEVSDKSIGGQILSIQLSK